MKLKDIADMNTYLEERCYCPYEIYDMFGFFFQFFKPETECEHLIGGERKSIHGDFVIARQDENSQPQIIYIEHSDGYVNDCVRIDATENNINQIKLFMAGKIELMNFDEYKPGETAKTLSEIMSMADAVMI